MRCKCCDKPVSSSDLDQPTGFYYCSECFEPTIEEQLRLADKEYINLENILTDQYGEMLSLEDVLFQKDRYLQKELRDNPEEEDFDAD